MAGRSDWILHDRRLELVSSVPEQPSWRALEAAVAETDDDRRRDRLRAHLHGLIQERCLPLGAAHPAYPAMELALWNHLHRGDPVAAMVAASGLSRAQAYRVFTACAGLGPAAAVRRARLDLVRRLLAERIPAAAVATRCGFSGIRQMRRLLRAAPPSAGEAG
jgi:AraC-like DNA-binding protein